MIYTKCQRGIALNSMEAMSQGTLSCKVWTSPDQLPCANSMMGHMLCPKGLNSHFCKHVLRMRDRLRVQKSKYNQERRYHHVTCSAFGDRVNQLANPRAADVLKPHRYFTRSDISQEDHNLCLTANTMSSI